MHEPVEVKIARIEEGMVRLHAKIDTNHEKLILLLDPTFKDVHWLKKSHLWTISLVAVIGIYLLRMSLI